MNYLKHALILVLTAFLLQSCQDDNEVVEKIDTEKPAIDLSVDGAFPAPCDTLYFGEPFTVKVSLSDNIELGSYNMDIHDNFDHHSHTTEFKICDLDSVKTAVNAYRFTQNYEIPENQTSYTTSLTMTIPDDDGTDKYDEGDYHFQIRVTDKEGWSLMKGYGVKILRR